MGAAFFMGAYMANAFTGAFAGGYRSPAEWDAVRGAGPVPLVGPWAQLALLPEGAEGWIAPLVMNGFVQAASFALMLVALLVL